MLRVVDSKGRELLLDVVSPSADTDELSRRQFSADGEPRTALGRMMRDLGVDTLQQLAPVMSGNSRTWVQVYRELCEWATLYDLIRYKDFAVSTLIVRDGLLRSKVFAGDYFVRLYHLLQEAIERVWSTDRCRVWLVGIAKKTEILEYYRLAISLSGLFARNAPCFTPIDHKLQEQAYQWDEYIRMPDDNTDNSGEEPKYNMGAMHFVRFGSSSGDPIWTVDLLASQAGDAQAIFGYLLADAVAGFPVPLYPYSLQQADAHSRVADLDLDIIEDNLLDAIREQVGPQHTPTIDALRLATDVAARRYE